MITVNIKEPYWGAWKEFGWSKGTWGIGLRKEYLDGMGEIKIISEYHKGKAFFLDKEQARKECGIGKHRPQGVALAVVPMTILEEEKKEPEPEITEEEPKQETFW